jgi:hypothetical protein
MRALALTLLLSLFANSVWAATWYVRPASGEYGLENGTSYANAFDGNTDAWATAGDIDAGDTVYFCGAHTEEILVGDTGSAGNPITLDFNCPDEPGSVDTSGSATNTDDGVEVRDRDYITIVGGTFTGKRHAVTFVNTNAGDSTGHVIRGATIDNRNASSATNVCHGIYFQGNGTFSNASALDNVVLGTSSSCASQSNNDGINFEDGLSGNVIRGNQITGANDGIDTSGNGMVIERNWSYGNRFSGIKVHGLHACPVGISVNSNLIGSNASWGIIFQDASNSTVANNSISHSGTLGGLQIETVNVCTDTGNIYANNHIEASYANGAVRVYSKTKAELESEDTWNGNNIVQKSGSNLLYFNLDTGNHVTSANWPATWSAAHPLDKQNESPRFLGGDTPTTAEGFRPDYGSPLVGAGTPVGVKYYFCGYSFNIPPSIGAFEVPGPSTFKPFQ